MPSLTRRPPLRGQGHLHGGLNHLLLCRTTGSHNSWQAVVSLVAREGQRGTGWGSHAFQICKVFHEWISCRALTLIPPRIRRWSRAQQSVFISNPPSSFCTSLHVQVSHRTGCHFFTGPSGGQEFPVRLTCMLEGAGESGGNRCRHRENVQALQCVCVQGEVNEISSSSWDVVATDGTRTFPAKAGIQR